MTDTNLKLLDSNGPSGLPAFSVLLCTYGGDNADELDAAIKSVFEQTVEPTEVVVVEDSTLTEALSNVLRRWERDRPEAFRVVSLSEPCNFGEALRRGVLACSNSIIARMDSDDLSLEHRFERQLGVLAQSPDIDCVGGYVEEFTGTPKNGTNVREVPTNPEELRHSARFRCPMNHPTVMYRKQAVLSAGNYRDIVPVEDYDLWVRMLLDGAVLTNLSEVVVKMRAEEDMFARRGGFDYFCAEFQLFNDFRQCGYLSNMTFIVNVLARLPIRLAPNTVRKWLYRWRLRK